MQPNTVATGPGTPGTDTTGISDEAVELMARHGITRSRVDIFGYGGFRCTTLGDAIAEAARHPGAR